MAAMHTGQSGSSDAAVENANSVGDFQTTLWRIMARLDSVENDVATNASGSEQQLAFIRVDVRALQQEPAADTGRKVDLVDAKSMSPTTYSGARSESYKAWSKRVKAYTNAKMTGFRMALEAVDKLPKDQQVDLEVFSGWNWKDAVEADSKLHDLLSMITAGEALSIVESVPSQRFEACRL